MRILHVGFGFRPFRHGGVMLYAEDLMEEQLRRGLAVAYFFAGRHYPLTPRNRLKRWARNGVQMREILNSTLLFGGEAGTLTPHDDLNHPPSEALFAEVLDELRPEVIHLQELIGLPSSLIDIAGDRGVPIVATLQDYLPLCPVLRLFDVDGQICRRHDVGEQCARCSAWAPETRQELLDLTVQYESLATGWRPRAVRALRAATRVRRESQPVGITSATGAANVDPPRARSASARSYQARRDVNVERLNRIDAVVVQSRRVAEIYRQLGVDASRVQVLQFTLRHIEGIAPKAISAPQGRVRFATLNGCASVQKGAEVVLGALAELSRAGFDDRFELTVLGHAHEAARQRLEGFRSARYGGYYDPARLDEVLEGYHVGIVPSVWEEAYGFVGVEFLAKGIPVIGNARGGILDYVREGETGWLNHEASASGLAAIMAKVIDDTAAVGALSASICREHDQIVKPFSLHAREIEEIYGQVVGKARCRETALAQASSAEPEAEVEQA